MEKMKHLIYSFKIGYWAFKNPQTLNAFNFKILSDMLINILKVANERRHYMWHIGYVHPEDGSQQEIVSIWAGAGIGAEPTKRITELLQENAELKTTISRLLEEKKHLNTK